MKLNLLFLLLLTISGLQAQYKFNQDSTHKVPQNPPCLKFAEEYTYSDSSNTSSIWMNVINTAIVYSAKFSMNDSIIEMKGEAQKTFIGLEFLENGFGESSVYVTDYEYSLSDEYIFVINTPTCKEAYISKKDYSNPIYLNLSNKSN